MKPFDRRESRRKPGVPGVHRHPIVKALDHTAGFKSRVKNTDWWRISARRLAADNPGQRRLIAHNERWHQPDTQCQFACGAKGEVVLHMHGPCQNHTSADVKLRH